MHIFTDSTGAFLALVILGTRKYMEWMDCADDRIVFSQEISRRGSFMEPLLFFRINTGGNGNGFTRFYKTK
jgi:hypothetical protein